jgi:integrase
MKAAGLPPIRLHDLRASYITAAIEAGVPIQVIAAHVGHANTSITMNIYARVLGGADEDAAAKVAAAILG